jgi:hypothetical protein
MRNAFALTGSHGVANQHPSVDCHSRWQCAHHSVVHRKNVQSLFQMQRAERQTQVAVSPLRQSLVSGGNDILRISSSCPLEIAPHDETVVAQTALFGGLRLFVWRSGTSCREEKHCASCFRRTVSRRFVSRWCGALKKRTHPTAASHGIRKPTVSLLMSFHAAERRHDL